MTTTARKRPAPYTGRHRSGEQAEPSDYTGRHRQEDQ